MSPTPRLAAGLAACALLALVAPAWLAVLVAAALALAAAVDALGLRGEVHVRREVAPVLARGVPSPLSVVVEPAERALVRQPLPAGLRALPPAGADGDEDPRDRGTARPVGAAGRGATAVPDLGVGGLEARLVADRRGAHELPPVAVRRTGPLGLARRDQRAGGSATVVVYPDYLAAERLAAAVRTGRGAIGERRRGPLGLGTEFEAVRDYVPDDDVRQINWLATWRTGRPMSNQYRVESERDVVLLVDCGRLVGAPVAGGASLLDAALDAAAALGAVADALGDRVGAVAFADDVRVDVPPARGGGATALRALHAVRPEPVDSDYAAAFARVGSARRAFVLLLTDLLDEAAVRPLRDAAPVLARRHALTVAGAEDPELAALVATAPRGTAEALRQAAAADVRAARDRAALALSAAGAGVLVAEPGALGRRCVAAYLDAKSRARF